NKNRPCYQPPFLPQPVRVADDLDACVRTPGIVHPKDPVTRPAEAGTNPPGPSDPQARPGPAPPRPHPNLPLLLTPPDQDVVPRPAFLLPVEPPGLRDHRAARDEPDVPVGPDEFRSRVPGRQLGLQGDESVTLPPAANFAALLVAATCRLIVL